MVREGQKGGGSDKVPPGITLRFLQRRRGSTSLFSARFLPSSRRREYRRDLVSFLLEVFVFPPPSRLLIAAHYRTRYTLLENDAAAGHAEGNLRLRHIDRHGNDKQYFILRSPSSTQRLLVCQMIYNRKRNEEMILFQKYTSPLHLSEPLEKRKFNQYERRKHPQEFMKLWRCIYS